MRLTCHADRRCTERRIPREIVQLIHGYGTPYRSRGAEGLKFDLHAIDLVADGNQRLRADLRRYRGAYLIVGDDDSIITVARETRRHRR